MGDNLSPLSGALPTEREGVNQYTERQYMDKMNQEKLEIIEILIKQRESIEKLKEASK